MRYPGGGHSHPSLVTPFPLTGLWTPMRWGEPKDRGYATRRIHRDEAWPIDSVQPAASAAIPLQHQPATSRARTLSPRTPLPSSRSL